MFLYEKCLQLLELIEFQKCHKSAYKRFVGFLSKMKKKKERENTVMFSFGVKVHVE